MTLPLPLDGGALPVTGTHAVSELEPVFIRRSDSAPVRDALRAALVAIFEGYQRRATYAAAQSDDLRATDIYQDGLGRDVDVLRQRGEDNEAYRARMLQTPGFVTPAAILAAVGSVLAPYSSVPPQYAESGLDNIFLESGTCEWSSHLFGQATVDSGFLSPRYPDRYYPNPREAFFQDDAGTFYFFGADVSGFVRKQATVRGALLFDDNDGRFFVLRVPDLAHVDDNAGFVSSDVVTPNASVALYVDNGTSVVDMTNFIFTGSASESTIYAAIINVVERLRGHGVRGTLDLDPLLTVPELLT